MPNIELMYLVDGFNLLHAAILKGRDRSHWWGLESQRRVVGLVAKFRAGEQASFQLCVVFDRRTSEKADSSQASCENVPGVIVHHAPSADDWIVECCLQRQAAPARRTVVVSADRALLDRCAHRGAERLSPWDFAQMCAGSASGRASKPGDVEQ